MQTRSPAVAEIADCTAYDSLINDCLDTLPCSCVAVRSSKNHKKTTERWC